MYLDDILCFDAGVVARSLRTNVYLGPDVNRIPILFIIDVQRDV